MSLLKKGRELLTLSHGYYVTMATAYKQHQLCRRKYRWSQSCNLQKITFDIKEFRFFVILNSDDPCSILMKELSNKTCSWVCKKLVKVRGIHPSLRITYTAHRFKKHRWPAIPMWTFPACLRCSAMSVLTSMINWYPAIYSHIVAVCRACLDLEFFLC